MKYDETLGKYLPENEEEQKFFDYAFNKGVAQGKKTTPPTQEPTKPEGAQNTTAMFDPKLFAEVMKSAVAEAVKPMQDDFLHMKNSNKQQLIEKVIARQTTKLPKAYLAQVDGTNEAEVKASFDKVSELYKVELKEAGVTFDFGAPSPGADNTGDKNKPAKGFKEMTPTEKISLYKENPDLYSKLASGK